MLNRELPLVALGAVACCEPLASEPLSPQGAEDLASLFKAVADPDSAGGRAHRLGAARDLGVLPGQPGGDGADVSRAGSFETALAELAIEM